MAKARASGSDAVHLLAKETTYGVPPAPGAGVYRRLPLRSLSLGEEQALEDDPVWNRSNPDDSDPSLGASTVTGDLVAPMDSRGIGFILTMALGAPVSVDNGDDTFTHTWKSGKELPSYVAQIGHPKLTVPKFRSQTGIKAGGLQFPMARNGRALVTVPLIAQKEVKDMATRDAAPLSYAYQPFDNATGGITVDGDAIANITGAQFNYSNGLEPVETIRADMAIDGVDENLRTCNGTANLRFGSDSTIDDLADSKTPAAVEYSFTLQALPDWSLKYHLPRVFFPRAKKPIEGPGGISITSNWRAAFDPTAGYMLAVVLVNDVATY